MKIRALLARLRPKLSSPLDRYLVRVCLLVVAWQVYRVFRTLTPGVEDLRNSIWGIFADGIGFMASLMLSVVGQPAHFSPSPSVVWIDGSAGVLVAPVCSAMGLIVVFCALVMLFPDSPLRRRISYSLFGSVVIYVVNAARVAALAVIVRHVAMPIPGVFDKRYHLALNYVIYLAIVILYLIWVAYLAHAPLSVRKSPSATGIHTH